MVYLEIEDIASSRNIKYEDDSVQIVKNKKKLNDKIYNDIIQEGPYIFCTDKKSKTTDIFDTDERRLDLLCSIKCEFSRPRILATGFLIFEASDGPNDSDMYLRVFNVKKREFLCKNGEKAKFLSREFDGDLCILKDVDGCKDILSLSTGEFTIGESVPYWDANEYFKKEYYSFYINHGYKICIDRVTEKWGLVNEKGDVVVPFEYDNISPFYHAIIRFPNEEIAYCQMKKGKNIYILDENLKAMKVFSDIDDINYYPTVSIHPYKMGELWGYMADNGGVVIKPQYSDANIFEESKYGKVALVKKDGKYYYINTDGSKNNEATIGR